MKLPNPFSRRRSNDPAPTSADGGTGEDAGTTELSDASRTALDELRGLDAPEGVLARRFFAAVDKAASLQGPAISKYVTHILDHHGDKPLAEQQRIVDRHFLALATGSGAGTGGLAFIPGVGTLLSIGAAGGEALAVVEIFALYTLASARLHGLDVEDTEVRRALILFTIAGSSGSDVVAAMAGQQGLSGLRALTGRQMLSMNSRLGTLAFRQLRRRLTGAAFQKLLPLGVGAFLGARANRRIATAMIDQVHRVFDDQQPE
ncbi:hypothetical protein [Corynebacterium bovis]|uniref:hypothetical protein n=1 Tax=Corynebacterium bovis TaxID=36808 RepID=UPI003139ECE9